ncbi:MAG: ANTAR domain-containing response regulator [Peptococcaceae bacterium]
MERILTVAASQQGQLLLQQLLQELPLPGSQHASTGAAARKLLQEEQFDLVLINAPLSDEYGDLVAKLAFSKSAAVILLIKAEHIDAVREKIAQTGIYMIAKPLRRAVFLQLVQCILQQEKKMRQLQEERDHLKQQMQEINLINRAKLVLMQVLKLSEPQAHRYIEKQAMDLRITKREVAEGVLNTYES